MAADPGGGAVRLRRVLVWAYRLVDGLVSFWARRGHYREGAHWADEALTAAGVPQAAVSEVARLVRLTRGHGPAADEAGRLMCDIDLSILGRAVEEFDAYERRIRAEYMWVPEEAFRHGRARILEGLLRRDPLFQTDTFHRRFESSARANLRRALAALAGPT